MKQLLPSVRRGSRRLSRPSLRLALACGIAAGVLCGGSARATDYYWDTNGDTAGAGTAIGNWNGTDANFNTALSGTGGTLTGLTTGSDTVQFSATPDLVTTAYTVTLTGAQNIQGISFRANALGTITGGTINLGSGGIVGNRYLVGTSGNQATASGFNIASALNLTASQTWTTSSLGAATVSGSTTGTGDLTLTEGVARTFTISGGLNMTGSLSTVGGNNQGTISITGVIGSNVTNLTVNSSASNIFILSGSNTYGGTTAVTSGVFQLSNTGTTSATGTSVVNLSASTGNIIGSGRSTGLLTVTNGGQISPGTATVAGTLSLGVTGGATLTQAALNFNLNSTAALVSDKLVTGALTLGALTFNFSPTSTNTTTTLQTGVAYTLIDGSNPAALDLSGTTFTTNFSGFSSGFTAAYSTNATGDLLVTFGTAVPEPSTWVGASLLLGFLGWRARRSYRRLS